MKTLFLVFTTFLFSNIFAIDAPTLLTPPDGSTGWYSIRSIQCYIVDGITDVNNYTFEMDVTPSFNSAELTSSVGTDYYTSSGGYIRKANDGANALKYGTTYYWRVKVTNGTETSVWSEVRSFSTLDQISLYSPANNVTGQYTDRSIRCHTEDYNTAYGYYDFEMDTTPNFDSPLHQITEGDGYSSSYDYVYKTNTDLLYGTTYYWRARVRNTNDTTLWSEVWNFTTLDQISLYSPANNATGQYTDRSIRCYTEDYNTAYGYYDFEMDTTPNFDSPLHQLTEGDGYSSSYDYVYKTNTDLLYGTTYYWRARVRNTNDTTQWSEIWNFTTLNQINLYTPANNSTGITINTNVSAYTEDYNTAYGYYDFQLDTSANFNSPALISTYGDGYNSSYDYVYKTNSNLRYGQKYYWRARVRNTNDTSLWSTVHVFTTAYEMTTAPDLVSPTNNSTDISYSSFSIEWNSIADANTYQYQISTSNDFVNIVSTGNTSLTNKTISNLQPNTVYYWRVRGENANGYSPWSTVWNFTTEAAVMTAPVLISPANNLTDVDYNSVAFSWNSTFGASEYIFEISQDQTFTSGLTTQNISSPNNILVGLDQNTQYFWRVASTDGNTTSSWSEVWNFTTQTNVNIDELSRNKNFSIYPNPAKDFIIIKTSSTAISEASIYNLDGQLILKLKNIRSNSKISIENLTSGIYIFQIGTNRQRFIVE